MIPVSVLEIESLHTKYPLSHCHIVTYIALTETPGRTISVERDPEILRDWTFGA